MAPGEEGDDLEADQIIDTFVDDARLKLKRATASLEAMRVTASTKLAAAAAKHAAARRALEGERGTFDREVREAEARNARAEDVVTLNVGGTKFTTSVETLCADADSMLAAMFSGRHALRPADDGWGLLSGFIVSALLGAALLLLLSLFRHARARWTHHSARAHWAVEGAAAVRLQSRARSRGAQRRLRAARAAAVGSP